MAEARTEICATATVVRSERVPLARANHRVLAEDVVATRALPGFDNSAMDGFAVRASDLPARLPVTGVVHAGPSSKEPLAKGRAIRIMTGAPMPPGADTVVMFEDSINISEGLVELPAVALGDNVRLLGSDVAIGETVLHRGATLRAGELGLLAALGQVEVAVAAQPRVALIATGDELVALGDHVGAGQLIDSSATTLAAAIADAGGTCTYLGIARDDLASLTAAIATALSYDVVLTTGGVSMGDHDFVRAALADCGVELTFWKVAMKPGKPVAFGRKGQTAVFGLPGNPVSSFTAFELFVRPYLRALLGARERERPAAPVVLVGGYQKVAGRAHFLRASIERHGSDLHATPHPKQGSAMMSSLVGIDALVEIPADATVVSPGATVQALLMEAR